MGYGDAPASTRFQKGQSGNPRGRPKGSRSGPPYDQVLGQMVAVVEAGETRKVTAAEAFLLHMTKRGLDGDGVASRIAMEAIGAARTVRGDESTTVQTIVHVVVEPGSLNTALQPLRMATKLDRYRLSARTMLEPWLVEAALARLGTRRLSRAEQRTVVRAVRTPHKVRWPDWWEIGPGEV